jgi:hypothetical protein
MIKHQLIRFWGHTNWGFWKVSGEPKLSFKFFGHKETKGEKGQIRVWEKQIGGEIYWDDLSIGKLWESNWCFCWSIHMGWFIAAETGIDQSTKKAHRKWNDIQLYNCLGQFIVCSRSHNIIYYIYIIIYLNVMSNFSMCSCFFCQSNIQSW